MAYDVKKAFQRIEDELIDSMMRNLQRYHLDWEDAEGFDWSQWQVEQLKALEQLRRSNPKKYGKQFASINAKLRRIIVEAEARGQKEEELRILEALSEGGSFPVRPSDGGKGVGGETFFRTNEGKLNALLDATQRDMEKAEHAVLRRADDQYRQIIFDAQVYANTGAGTVEKAVDMATKDFLARGIDSIVYRNGARHTISDYADMAIRTAERRAYLAGAGQKRQEWGLSLVIVNRRGTMQGGNFGHACPHCIPWLGKVLIDDVYSDGKPDGVHPLLSEAMAAGFLHPRCKDGFTTYFPGISTAPDPATKQEVAQAVENEREGNRERYAQRQAEKYERLSKYSLDPANRKQYEARAEEWKRAQSGSSDTPASTPVPLRSHAPVNTSAQIQQVEQEALELKVQADYSNYTPELAKTVNQSIREVQDQFGELTELNLVGTHPNVQGDVAGAFFPNTGLLALRNPGQPDIMQVMKDEAEAQFASGGWSTGDARHVIVHELGHALEKQYLTPEKRAELERIRKAEVLRVTGDENTDIEYAAKEKSPMMDSWGKSAKEDLSLYGLISVKEMISESLAQNILGEPGGIAQQTILILLGR